MRLDEAVRLYTGKVMFWPDGQSVIVVALPRDHFVSREFIYENLGISPYQFYESLDISIKIRKNNTIIKVSSESEMIKSVIKNAGSIGFSSEYIYYNYREEVKKLRIQ